MYVARTQHTLTSSGKQPQLFRGGFVPLTAAKTARTANSSCPPPLETFPAWLPRRDGVMSWRPPDKLRFQRVTRGSKSTSRRTLGTSAGKDVHYLEWRLWLRFVADPHREDGQTAADAREHARRSVDKYVYTWRDTVGPVGYLTRYLSSSGLFTFLCFLSLWKKERKQMRMRSLTIVKHAMETIEGWGGKGLPQRLWGQTL